MKKLTKAKARKILSYYTSTLDRAISPEGINPAQVVALPTIGNDRHSLLVYGFDADPSTLRLHGVWCVRRALANRPFRDSRAVAAVDVAERFALGTATVDEMMATWDAADEMRGSSVGRAARYIVCLDSCHAASNAAWQAARSHAVDDAWDARATPERLDAWDAEKECQIQDLALRLSAER